MPIDPKEISDVIKQRLKDFDASLVSTDVGRIVATSDGGTTWAKQATHTTTDLDSVATTINGAPFWTSTGDYHDAIAVGGNGVVLMTTDAGVTWTKVNAGTKVGLEGTD